RIGEIGSCRKSKIRSQLRAVADITISARTLHFSNISKRIGDNSNIFRYLHTLLENSITLILEKVNHEIDFIVKKLSLNSDVCLNSPLPGQVICPYTRFLNSLNPRYPPYIAAPFHHFGQIRKSYAGNSIVADCSVGCSYFKII